MLIRKSSLINLNRISHFANSKADCVNAILGRFARVNPYQHSFPHNTEDMISGTLEQIC